MNKTLRFFSMLVMCMTTLLCSAQTTITLGYCNSEITADDYRLPSSGAYTIMAAVHIPASQLASLKGARLTKLRIGVDGGITSTYAWVRPSLQGDPLTIKRVGTTKDGWNEVELPVPYVITGDDIYLGFTGSFAKGKSLIFNGSSNPNGAYVAISGSWTDHSSTIQGSLCIQGIVESDVDVSMNDLGLERFAIDDNFATNGDVRHVSLNVSNYGTEQAAMPALHYQLGDGAVHDVTTTDNSAIGPSESRVVTFDVPISDMDEGSLNMKVWIDSNDSYADNNSVQHNLYVYTTSYARTMLVEQFTTLPCTFCPNGQKLLDMLTTDVDNVVWVAHHVGFGTDQFTIGASEDLLPFGVTSAPRAMFDRSIVKLSQNDKPAFGIGNDPQQGLLLTQGIFDEMRQRPAFATVGIESAYDETTRQLALTVSGERTKLCSEIYPNTNLTLYLVEDSLVSIKPQTGGTPADTIHNHVVREVLTSSLGTPIVWDGNTYTEQFATTLPTDYNVANLKVVAFVNRPLNDDDYTSVDVLNSASLSVAKQTSGIHTAINTDNGRVLRRSYYNLQGQRLQTPPTTGVYVERLDTTDGMKVVKHMAR